jgi:hypothetical protein
MRRLVVLVLFAAACRAKSDAAPCGTVAGQFFQLANRDLGSASIDSAPPFGGPASPGKAGLAIDDKTRRAVSDQLPAMRDQLALACTEGAWSGAVRTCMANAQDHAAFQACEQQLTDDQRKALDRASAEPPPSH